MLSTNNLKNGMGKAEMKHKISRKVDITLDFVMSIMYIKILKDTVRNRMYDTKT